VRFLLDTCTVLWWCFDSARIPAAVRDRIERHENDVYVSVISPWEISIKEKLDRFAEFPANLGQRLRGEIASHQFADLGITWPHALRAGSLSLHHHDPFDRMLVAQAQLEGLALVSPDPAFRPYEVETFWA